MTRRPLLVCAVFAALVITQARSAFAQMGPFITGVTTSTIQPLSPANGLQVGDGVLLHMGVGAEGGYDSNVFYTDSNRVGSTVLRVTPFLDLTNTARSGEIPSAIFFDLNAALTYKEYITDQNDITSLRAFVPTLRGALSHAGGTFSETVTEAFTRLEDAPYTRNSNQGLIIRDNNVASAQLGWAPGGGRLQGVLRYTNTLDLFENEYLKNANSVGHEGMIDASWRWLPKTALYLQIRQGYISYLNSNSVSTATLGTKHNSFPLRATLGIRGLMTEKTSIALGVGYQNSFYADGVQNTSGFLGSTSLAAELVVLPIMFTRIALGVRHDFQNSVIGNFYYDDGVYASVSQQTVARLIGQLWGSYDYRRYYGLPDSADPRKDNVIQAGAILDYYLKTWAYAGVSYSLAYNQSDYQPMGTTLSGANYTKHQVFARLGITY